MELVEKGGDDLRVPPSVTPEVQDELVWLFGCDLFHESGHQALEALEVPAVVVPEVEGPALLEEGVGVVLGDSPKEGRDFGKRCGEGAPGSLPNAEGWNGDLQLLFSLSDPNLEDFGVISDPECLEKAWDGEEPSDLPRKERFILCGDEGPEAFENLGNGDTLQA